MAFYLCVMCRFRLFVMFHVSPVRCATLPKISEPTEQNPWSYDTKGGQTITYYSSDFYLPSTLLSDPVEITQETCQWMHLGKIKAHITIVIQVYFESLCFQRDVLSPRAERSQYRYLAYIFDLELQWRSYLPQECF